MAAGQTVRAGNLASILGEVRKELLDFGLRNPLLNYRLLKSRGVDVVSERPPDIHRILVFENKRFSFLPAEQATGALPSGEGHATDDDSDESQPAVPSAGGEGHFTDTYLQTALTSKQLQDRLLATYRTARSSLEEQGVNTLFLVLGMLNWREADAAEEAHRAPLILVPVELERSNARDRFRLKCTSEEIGGNVCLSEYLKQVLGIDFPHLNATEDEIDIPCYFQNAKTAVAGQKNWTVAEDSIALEFFSFAKFLMYRVLDPASWPKAEALLENALLDDLLGTGTLFAAGQGESGDDFLDDRLHENQTPHLMDADSSQVLALLDIAAGRNMVIQGPPGTGKSQTIVNVIAEAVAAGKTVLFVSEKKAALEVVKRRLDAVGLGPACLVLHSNKTNKKAIVEDLKKTTQSGSGAAPAADVGALAGTRAALNDYSMAVNQTIGRNGETPFNLYGRLSRADARPAGIDCPALNLSRCSEWDDTEVSRKTALVEKMEDRAARCGVPARHPF